MPLMKKSAEYLLMLNNGGNRFMCIQASVQSPLSCQLDDTAVSGLDLCFKPFLQMYYAV